jgi:hypothetical protein
MVKMNEYWGYGWEWEGPSPEDKRIIKNIQKALNIKIRQAKGRRLKKQEKVRV